jgi:glycosyltransferase involved in cell wall biosynthesis
MSHSDVLPLVSVIVPNYNHARFLPERLASIFNQSYENIEVILLDDASADNSATILQNWAAEYPQVSHLCINENNTGRAICQWQRGVELANGDYIWIAESDDVAAPNFIETLLSLLAEKPNVGFAYSDSEVINEQGGSLGTYVYSSPLYMNQNPWSHSFTMAGKDFVGCYMAYRNVVPNVSAVLFRASAIQPHIQASELKYCADWQLYNRILCHYDIIFCHEPLNQFRKHVLSSRWHDSISYARELKEKLHILKSLRLQFVSQIQYQTNINSSIAYLFKHRHKHKHIKQLCNNIVDADIQQCTEVILFGANDISEKIIDFLASIRIIPLVIDNNKVGLECHGCEIKRVDVHHLSTDSLCVLCTFSHQQSMKDCLSHQGYRGRVLEI